MTSEIEDAVDRQQRLFEQIKAAILAADTKQELSRVRDEVMGDRWTKLLPRLQDDIEALYARQSRRLHGGLA